MRVEVARPGLSVRAREGFLDVSRAAEALYLSQPAVSLQLKALEREVGQRLFERSGRRLALTPEGELLMTLGVAPPVAAQSAPPGLSAVAQGAKADVNAPDAQGTPPNLPFWLGEAPARSRELSAAVTRIREEIRNGNTPQAAIHSGYEKAFSAIADGNITTLIAAIVLFTFGTGPIRGFAVTLSPTHSESYPPSSTALVISKIGRRSGLSFCPRITPRVGRRIPNSIFSFPIMPPRETAKITSEILQVKRIEVLAILPDLLNCANVTDSAGGPKYRNNSLLLLPSARKEPRADLVPFFDRLNCLEKAAPKTSKRSA